MSLIRVGRGYPTIVCLSDRWGRTSHHYESPSWFWTDPDFWEKLEQFQALTEDPGLIQTRIRLNPSRSLIWQFNAIDGPSGNEVRHTVTMGTNEVRRWSWAEAYVVYPLLKFVAGGLTQCLHWLDNRRL